MKIRNKTCIVFDIESLKNIFTCTCKDTETDKITIFELSSRKVDIEKLINYFKQDCYFVGYNNIHYDNPVLNYIIELYNLGFFNTKSTRQIIESIHNLSKLIISKEDGAVDKWKKYKWAKNYLSIDLLTMLYSKALRVSLKEMQVTMQYSNVEEFIVDWNANLPENQFDKLISYNINDVNSTTELLNRCKDDLELRIAIEDEYKINCLSLDGVNLGMQILEQEYIRHTGISKDKLESLRSPCSEIDLEKVILPWIEFDTPILQDLLKEMKSLHNVSPGRKGYEKTFLFGEMKTTVGVGGIHGDCGVCTIVPQEDEVLLDSDINSLYPSLIIEHGFYPPHLGKEFLEVYSSIRTKRLKAKKEKNKVVDKTYKLSLNGLSGNLQNENSWCYSPFAVMQVRINGQLFLLKFCEKLLSIGCKLKQINTDGALYICKKDKLDQLKQIIKEFEQWSKLTFETDEFLSFYQLAINDYFGVTPKYLEDRSLKNIKEKGFFITDVLLGKGLTPKIIPEAIINYFIEAMPVEETIKECKDIRKFLQAEKTGKQWTVEYNDKIQQRTNRFYVSDNGYYLWKYKVEDGEKKYQNMLKGYGVTLHNTFYTDDYLQSMYSQGKSFYDIYHINYSYYINQAKKIIEELKPRQLSLFNFD